MEHPEWAAYLAAFDAYVDARREGNQEHAEQARLLMGYFAHELLDDEHGLRRPRDHYEIRALLRQLGLD